MPLSRSSPPHRPSPRWLGALALLCLFVLRAFLVPAHIALEHGHERIGTADSADGARIEARHGHRHSHHGDHDHPVEDHLEDLLAQRCLDPLQAWLLEPGRLFSLDLRLPLGWLRPGAEPPRPRARAPGSQHLRAPPAA